MRHVSSTQTLIAPNATLLTQNYNTIITAKFTHLT